MNSKTKTVGPLLALFFLVCCTLEATAQDCASSFYQMKEGATFTLTSYDAAKKPVGNMKHTYRKVSKTGTGLSAQVEQEMTDQQGKQLSKGTYEITCQNGVIKLNMQDLMGPGMNMQNANIKMELSGDALELPADLKVGQTLKDASLNMKAMMGQTKMMEQQMQIKNRKVEAKETVETPAGKFESYKVSHLTESSGMMGKPMAMKTITWYAKGPGMVKTESYDANGKLSSYTVLTSYSK